jgi:hypothetical protein
MTQVQPGCLDIPRQPSRPRRRRYVFSRRRPVLRRPRREAIREPPTTMGSSQRATSGRHAAAGESQGATRGRREAMSGRGESIRHRRRAVRRRLVASRRTFKTFHAAPSCHRATSNRDATSASRVETTSPKNEPKSPEEATAAQRTEASSNDVETAPEENEAKPEKIEAMPERVETTSRGNEATCHPERDDASRLRDVAGAKTDDVPSKRARARPPPDVVSSLLAVALSHFDSVRSFRDLVSAFRDGAESVLGLASSQRGIAPPLRGRFSRRRGIVVGDAGRTPAARIPNARWLAGHRAVLSSCARLWRCRPALAGARTARLRDAACRRTVVTSGRGRRRAILARRRDAAAVKVRARARTVRKRGATKGTRESGAGRHLHARLIGSAARELMAGRTALHDVRSAVLAARSGRAVARRDVGCERLAAGCGGPLLCDGQTGHGIAGDRNVGTACFQGCTGGVAGSSVQPGRRTATETGGLIPHEGLGALGIGDAALRDGRLAFLSLGPGQRGAASRQGVAGRLSSTARTATGRDGRARKQAEHTELKTEATHGESFLPRWETRRSHSPPRRPSASGSRKRSNQIRALPPDRPASRPRRLASRRSGDRARGWAALGNRTVLWTGRRAKASRPRRLASRRAGRGERI